MAVILETKAMDKPGSRPAVHVNIITLNGQLPLSYKHQKKQHAYNLILTFGDRCLWRCGTEFKIGR